MALEPITRKEKIIAGQDLTPITRMEKFLKQFGGGGGSGLPTGGQPYQQLVTDGTGNAKWEDRLAYTGVTETELIGEQTVSFSASGSGMTANIPGSSTILTGDTVTVNWDGIAYTCTVQDSGGLKMLGNLSIFGAGADTGEPFAIGYNNSWIILTNDSSTEHIISVAKKNKVVKRIDAKYTGLFIFTVYTDDKAGLSTSVSYDDVRAAFDAKIPIFAQRIFTLSGIYVETYQCCESISTIDGGLEFLFKSKIIKYFNDGTITEENAIS